jgi:hypothetical protein
VKTKINTISASKRPAEITVVYYLNIKGRDRKRTISFKIIPHTFNMKQEYHYAEFSGWGDPSRAYPQRFGSTVCISGNIMDGMKLTEYKPRRARRRK